MKFIAIYSWILCCGGLLYTIIFTIRQIIPARNIILIRKLKFLVIIAKIYGYLFFIFSNQGRIGILKPFLVCCWTSNKMFFKIFFRNQKQNLFEMKWQKLSKRKFVEKLSCNFLTNKKSSQGKPYFQTSFNRCKITITSQFFFV